MQETKSIAVNKYVPLYVNGKKKEALIKEVRFLERTPDSFNIEETEDNQEFRQLYKKRYCKDQIRYVIEIDGETLLYGFAVKGENRCFLTGYKNNDIYDEEVEIEITNYKNLLDLLWEITEYSHYGMLYCFAGK